MSPENSNSSLKQFSTWSSVGLFINEFCEKEQESETLEPGVMLDFMFALEMFINRRKSDKLSVLVLEKFSIIESIGRFFIYFEPNL